ncbi:MAG: hypothetical protein DRH23_05285 [Deltaproteobacteria bacterium]|nr:MAG: hypothetical protein DRH23_05285 [Deltaproteobacteria bacterium]
MRSTTRALISKSGAPKPASRASRSFRLQGRRLRPSPTSHDKDVRTRVLGRLLPLQRRRLRDVHVRPEAGPAGPNRSWPAPLDLPVLRTRRPVARLGLDRCLSRRVGRHQIRPLVGLCVGRDGSIESAMIFRRKDTPKEALPEARDRLAEIVEQYLADADDATRRIVTAVAGLLARIAYADGSYSAQEEAAIRKELSRVHGLSQSGVDAICGLLADQISHVALLGDHDWTRDLRERGGRELRLEVLEVRIEMAVADQVLKHGEQTQLRRIAKALNLTQDEYNALQAKHRDKLSTLS